LNSDNFSQLRNYLITTLQEFNSTQSIYFELNVKYHEYFELLLQFNPNVNESTFRDYKNKLEEKNKEINMLLQNIYLKRIASIYNSSMIITNLTTIDEQVNRMHR